MNESEVEVIEDMFDRISHTRMDAYASLIKDLSGQYYDATTETMANDHHMSLAWMEGFNMALEWVLQELNGVQEISPQGVVIQRMGAAHTFIGSQEEE